MFTPVCDPCLRLVRRRLLAALSPLGLIAGLSLLANPAAAQTAAPERTAEQLRQIEVTAPRRKPPRRRAAPGAQPAPAAASATDRGPAVEVRNTHATPLNFNVTAESASYLGLKPREIPATVEVIDQHTIKEQGYRTTTEAAQGFVGVTAADPPGAASNFSMRGFTGSQINVLYNGIRTGPQEFTSRIMDTGNLDRIEILKGPASLMSGEGATGGAINYITRRPHTGKIVHEAFTSFDSFNGYRAGYGSGGSTTIKGLDYRFDLTRASKVGFIDDTYTKIWNASGQLDYRVTDVFKVWFAAEYKEDKDRFYWGTPMVPVSVAGANGVGGILAGSWTTRYFDAHNLGPVTIDGRTLKTSYNVLDNDSGAKELWLRGGFDYDVDKQTRIKSQVYAYNADRHWFNNEASSFNPDTGLVERDRFFVAHDHQLYGGITEIVRNDTIFGFDNRWAAALQGSTTDFKVQQRAFLGSDPFPWDTVSLINPSRAFYTSCDNPPTNTCPFVTNPRRAQLDVIAATFENRLKLTRTFALIGGVRAESISLRRESQNQNGVMNAGFPLYKNFRPVTGRVGYTWEAVPGLTFYGQYATAADPAVATIFRLPPNLPLELTRTRTYEAGVKQVLWGNRAEWTFSAFDIQRKNVFQSATGQNTNLASLIKSKGIEIAGGVRPTDQFKLWANLALIETEYGAFIDTAGNDFTGRRPPNVPRVVANAGAAYRFLTPWPVEVGGSVRHVGDRFIDDANTVTMLEYTLGDVYVFVDIPKWALSAVDETRLAFRVRNVTDRKFAAWVDTSYPDQILLGAPRSFEVAASFKW
jgi:iron complex outermembrane receptor protein